MRGGRRGVEEVEERNAQKCSANNGRVRERVPEKNERADEIKEAQ